MSEYYIFVIYYITKLLIELVNEHKKNRPTPGKN